MLIYQRQFLIMICVCDIIIICVPVNAKDYKKMFHFGITAQTDFVHTKVIPSDHLVHDDVAEASVTRYFVIIEQSEPLHVTITSCHSDIDVIVKHRSTLRGRDTDLTTTSDRGVVSFVKDIAHPGLYTFVVMSPGADTRLEFDRRPPTVTPPVTPTLKLLTAQRRTFTVEWPRTTTTTGVAVRYCVSVRRVISSSSTTNKRYCSSLPTSDLYCSTSNLYTYTGASPGRAYRVRVFAVNEVTGQSVAYHTLKVNTKRRTRELSIRKGRVHRVLVPRFHQERYMSFSQYKHTAARLQMVVVPVNRVPLKVTVYRQGRTIYESEPSELIVSFSLTIPRGRYVVRLSDDLGHAYCADVDFSISDARRLRRPPPVVSLPFDRTIRLDDAGDRLSWMSSSTSRPQRYCLYRVVDTPLALLRRSMSLTTKRRFGDRLFCTKPLTSSKRLGFPISGFKGSDVYIVYVVPLDRKVMERHLQMLQVRT